MRLDLGQTPQHEPDILAPVTDYCKDQAAFRALP